MLDAVFGHDNIINLLSTFFHDNHFYLVMEYAENSDLHELIIERGTLSLEVTKAYAAQMVLALEKLQEHNISHRDIKPQNFVLDKNYNAKLIDFGEACVLEKPKAATKYKNIM